MGFLDEALARLAATPDRAAELIHGMSEEQLSLQAEGGFFSLRENVAHLRDIDAQGYERRIARIFVESYPTLPYVDGARLARDPDYLHQPLPPPFSEPRT